MEQLLSSKVAIRQTTITERGRIFIFMDWTITEGVKFWSNSSNLFINTRISYHLTTLFKPTYFIHKAPNTVGGYFVCKFTDNELQSCNELHF